MLLYISINFALVAQLDRAFGYEPKGRGFESRRARQKIQVERLGFFTFRIDKLKKCAIIVLHKSGGIAQPVRAFGSHPRGRGFESLCLHQNQRERQSLSLWFWQKKLTGEGPVNAPHLLKVLRTEKHRSEKSRRKTGSSAKRGPSVRIERQSLSLLIWCKQSKPTKDL